MSYKFEIVLSWSGVDGVFVAEVLELPGCTAHSDTQEGAIRNINEAIALWIAMAEEFGDPIPEPKGERPMQA